MSETRATEVRDEWDLLLGYILDESNMLLGCAVKDPPIRYRYRLATGDTSNNNYISIEEARRNLLMHNCILRNPIADFINEPLEMLKLRLSLLHISGVIGDCGHYDAAENGFQSCTRCHQFVADMLDASYWRSELKELF